MKIIFKISKNYSIIQKLKGKLKGFYIQKDMEINNIVTMKSKVFYLNNIYILNLI